MLMGVDDGQISHGAALLRLITIGGGCRTLLDVLY